MAAGVCGTGSSQRRLGAARGTGGLEMGQVQAGKNLCHLAKRNVEALRDLQSEATGLSCLLANPL